MPEFKVGADDVAKIVDRIARKRSTKPTKQRFTTTLLSGGGPIDGGGGGSQPPPNQTFKNPMTTIWDIIVGGTSGAARRLGIGDEGQVLSVVSGEVAWADATGGGGGGGSFDTILVNDDGDVLTNGINVLVSG